MKTTLFCQLVNERSKKYDYGKIMQKLDKLKIKKEKRIRDSKLNNLLSQSYE